MGAWEEWEPSEMFVQDAPQTPHVNLFSVWEDPEHNVGCSVESRLYVSVDNFILEAARAKVSNDDPRLVFLLHEDVLGLEIAVNDAQLFEVFETCK